MGADGNPVIADDRNVRADLQAQMVNCPDRTDRHPIDHREQSRGRPVLTQ